jgi:putative peptidoglycan lipid II flippase
VTAVTDEQVPTVAVGRATASIAAWNVVSRVTGFGRAVAMAAALGATALGDTYQAANLVSNILFELLAAGALSAVLVPELVARRGRDDVVFAGQALGVAAAALGAIAVVGIVLAEPLMRALSAGADDATRDARVDLGAFLLLFVLPQLVLYAAGAVSTALLQARHRFVAAAAAPVGNNLVVIASMVAFRSLRDGDAGLVDAGSSGAVLLGAGTLAGVLAMTAIPFLALRRAGASLRPRWPGAGAQRSAVGDLVRRGVWAAGQVGAHQLLVLATIVVAAAVEGGVVATQVALTFFLLPHAVLANPVFTARFPGFAADARAGRLDELARGVRAAARSIVLLVAPAAALLAALAEPALRLLRLGALDADGALLVAGVLAAQSAGLLGYSLSFLFTRASYALGDVRTPTSASLGAAVAGVVAMGVIGATVDGDTRVVALGAAFAATYTITGVLLGRSVNARLPEPALALGDLARAVVGAALAAAAALGATSHDDGTGRAGALAELAAGAVTGAAVYAAVIWATAR